MTFYVGHNHIRLHSRYITLCISCVISRVSVYNVKLLLYFFSVIFPDFSQYRLCLNVCIHGILTKFYCTYVYMNFCTIPQHYARIYTKISFHQYMMVSLENFELTPKKSIHTCAYICERTKETQIIYFDLIIRYRN